MKAPLPLPLFDAPTPPTPPTPPPSVLTLLSAPLEIRAWRYRLVRNPAIEVYVRGQLDPYAPWFDVEGIDQTGMTVCVIAYGVGAEAARRIIAKVGGIEVG